MNVSLCSPRASCVLSEGVDTSQGRVGDEIVREIVNINITSYVSYKDIVPVAVHKYTLYTDLQE